MLNIATHTSMAACIKGVINNRFTLWIHARYSIKCCFSPPAGTCQCHLPANYNAIPEISLAGPYWTLLRHHCRLQITQPRVCEEQLGTMTFTTHQLPAVSAPDIQVVQQWRNLNTTGVCTRQQTMRHEQLDAHPEVQRHSLHLCMCIAAHDGRHWPQEVSLSQPLPQGTHNQSKDSASCCIKAKTVPAALRIPLAMLNQHSCVAGSWGPALRLTTCCPQPAVWPHRGNAT